MLRSERKKASILASKRRILPLCSSFMISHSRRFCQCVRATSFLQDGFRVDLASDGTPYGIIAPLMNKAANTSR